MTFITAMFSLTIGLLCFLREIILASKEIIAFLMDPSQKWTVVATSNNKQFSNSSNRIITMEKGKISNILNK